MTERVTPASSVAELTTHMLAAVTRAEKAEAGEARALIRLGRITLERDRVLAQVVELEARLERVREFHDTWGDTRSHALNTPTALGGPAGHPRAPYS